MTKLVHITLTDRECLEVRLALNAAAMHWGDKASVAVKHGARIEAETCNHIRAGLGAIWEKVAAAQRETNTVVHDGMAAAPTVAEFDAWRREVESPGVKRAMGVFEAGLATRRARENGE